MSVDGSGSCPGHNLIGRDILSAWRGSHRAEDDFRLTFESNQLPNRGTDGIANSPQEGPTVGHALPLFSNEDLSNVFTRFAPEARPAEMRWDQGAFSWMWSTAALFINIHFMQDVADRLRAFMTKNGLSQAQLAEKAQVSQPTVSRALSGRAIRKGSARLRLFSYAGISEYSEVRGREEARARVVAAFDRVWDNSEALAEAIVSITDALAELYQPTRKDEEK